MLPVWLEWCECGVKWWECGPLTYAYNAAVRVCPLLVLRVWRSAVCPLGLCLPCCLLVEEYLVLGNVKEALSNADEC